MKTKMYIPNNPEDAMPDTGCKNCKYWDGKICHGPDDKPVDLSFYGSNCEEWKQEEKDI